MRRTLLPFLFLLALGVLGCQGGEQRVGDVIPVKPNDPEIAAATKEAQAKLDEFIKHLSNADPKEYLSIKAGLETPDGTHEHIWIEGLTYKDGVFSGKIGNEPERLPNLKLGSPVTVKREDVEDWLIQKDGKFKGGFSVDILAKRAGQAPIPR